MNTTPPSRSATELGLNAEVAVTGLVVDSRKAHPGCAFFALPGLVVHGATFADVAARKGAALIVTDAEGAALIKDAGLSCMLEVTKTPRRALAIAASAWFGMQPEVMTAVTGTNGKTSVASFTRQIWAHMGLNAVNFGTAGVEGAVNAPLSHTTPEPITLHGLLQDLATQGVSHAAMEASSHGLAQHRLDGVELRAAGFTNLTRDHLDYHLDFKDYLSAKLGLFTRVLPPHGVAVVNLDDPASAKVVETVQARGQTLLTTGRMSGADLRLLETQFQASGQHIRFGWRGQVFEADLNLIGAFQAENVLMAAGLAIGAGADAVDVFQALPALQTVHGRMEHAGRRKNGAAVYVDYAHTPDSLATALKALRPHVAGQLVVVFGAGGDRDQGKRPLMGQAAADHADMVIVTDDNPRSETPSVIRAAVLAGCPGAREIADRAEAILIGVDMLGAEDVLLIAGKGHETGQIIGDQVLPFDDCEQARVSIAALDGDLE